MITLMCHIPSICPTAMFGLLGQSIKNLFLCVGGAVGRFLGTKVLHLHLFAFSGVSRSELSSNASLSHLCRRARCQNCWQVCHKRRRCLDMRRRSVSLSVCLSACLSVCVSVCLSVYLLFLQHVCDTTNLASVNLVMGCSKVFSFTILTAALAY